MCHGIKQASWNVACGFFLGNAGAASCKTFPSSHPHERRWMEM